MKIKNQAEVTTFLNKVLSGAYFNRFTYGITYFEAGVRNDALKIRATLIISDFELENKTEWGKWLLTYPLNLVNFNGPEEPARGLLMTLLTQVKIKDVVEEHRGTLILHFENAIRVRLKGEVAIADVSWSILFKDEQDENIGSVYCSFNEMFLQASDALMKRINHET